MVVLFWLDDDDDVVMEVADDDDDDDDDGVECWCWMYNVNFLCWLRFTMDSNEFIIHFGGVTIDDDDDDDDTKPNFW